VSLYNSQSQLWRQVDPDGATTLFTYNPKGERTGLFWVDGLPLLPGTNLLTLTATDLAGNSSVTNITVVQSDVLLTIDDFPGQDLNAGFAVSAKDPSFINIRKNNATESERASRGIHGPPAAPARCFSSAEVNKFRAAARLACLGALLLRATAAEVQAATGEAPKDPQHPEGLLGSQTNDLRLALSIRASSLQVFVLTSETNADWRYIAPPGRKLLACELRDPRGNLVPLRSKRRLTAGLPARIPIEDLPRVWRSAHNSAGLLDWLLVSAARPGRLVSETSLTDFYAVREPGEYALTVRAAVYEYVQGRPYATRIDLPPASAKVHLEPKPKQLVEPRAYGPALWNILGLTLCLGATAWLAWHWRAHRPRQIP
jgi:YD repeat-containing protein